MVEQSQIKKRALDLSEVAIRLKGKEKAFYKAVNSFHAAESVVLDLKSALASAHALLAMEGPQYASQVGSALLTHAVITYARATDIVSNTRYKVPATKSYSPKQQTLHREIIELRHQALAHFGPGQNRWNDERVVYYETGHGPALTFVSYRTNFDTRIPSIIVELTTYALQYLRTVVTERAGILNRLISEASPQLNQLASEWVFDVEKFYDGSETAIAQFWEPESFNESFSIEVNGALDGNPLL